LSRLVKIDFYRAAQARSSSGDHPLAGIIMDEFPLCATTGSARWSDVSNLATLRGKGVFVIAAAQGLVNLDLVIKPNQTQALLTNFSSLILLRSQETGFLYQFAERLFGLKPVSTRPIGHFSEFGSLILTHPSGVSIEWKPVCPEGALARLEPHQAFIALANGYRTLDPVWLAPLFFTPAPETDAPVVDRDLALLRTVERKSDPEASEVRLPEICSLQLFHVLLAHPRRNRPSSVVSLKDFLSGLHKRNHVVGPTEAETIPPCWRKAILEMASKLPKYWKIIGIGCEDGCLEVDFLVENFFGGIDELENRTRQWQRSVYPSRNRPPNRSDLAWLEKNFWALLLDFSSQFNTPRNEDENIIEDLP